MHRDILFLLKPGFTDPALPGQDFYCWHCALVEGVLASFPHLGAGLDIRRIAFPRPRADVIALIGEAHQSLPVLILADDAPAGLATATHAGKGGRQRPDGPPRCAPPAPRLPPTASLTHRAFGPLQAAQKGLGSAATREAPE